MHVIEPSRFEERSEAAISRDARELIIVEFFRGVSRYRARAEPDQLGLLFCSASLTMFYAFSGGVQMPPPLYGSYGPATQFELAQAKRTGPKSCSHQSSQ